jgi:uncharacterized membrane protein (DUF106 family)
MKDNYRTLGEYVSAFEVLISLFRRTILETLYRTGLKDNDIALTLISHRSYSAGMIKDTTMALIGVYLDKFHQDDKHVKQLRLKIREVKPTIEEIIKRRNVILHSSYWEDFDGELKASKLKQTKKGFQRDKIESVKRELNEEIKKIREADKQFRYVYYLFFNILRDLEQIRQFSNLRNELLK